MKGTDTHSVFLSTHRTFVPELKLIIFKLLDLCAVEGTAGAERVTGTNARSDILPANTTSKAFGWKRVFES